MKKTLFLTTLLIGLFLATETKAAENKNMKTAIDEVKIYTDSGLSDYKKGRDGSVYETKGNKKISGKEYTKSYIDGQFVGYIEANKLRAFVGEKDERKIKIVKSDYERWGNFYWTNTKGKAKKGSTFTTKMRFQIGNGKNFYSLYNEEGKFAGFINANATNQKNVWTTSSAIIMFKRMYKNNASLMDKYIEVGNYSYKDWTPLFNKKNTIILKRQGTTKSNYIKMISSGRTTIVAISSQKDPKVKKPEVTFTVMNSTAKIINKK